MTLADRQEERRGCRGPFLACPLGEEDERTRRQRASCRWPATSDRPPTTGDWTIAIAPATRMPSLMVTLLRVHGRAPGRRCGRGAKSCGGVWWCIRGGRNGGRGRPSIASVPPICAAGNAGTGEVPAVPCYRGSGRLRRMVGAGAVRAIRVSRARMASAWRRSPACMRPGPCAKGRRRRRAHSRAGYGRRRGVGWGCRLGHSARACRASAHGNRTAWARSRGAGTPAGRGAGRAESGVGGNPLPFGACLPG